MAKFKAYACSTDLEFHVPDDSGLFILAGKTQREN